MQTSYWQAKITALLGDKEAAVSHLYDLLGSQGRYMHPDMDWESLQNFRRFQELIKAKG